MQFIFFAFIFFCQNIKAANYYWIGGGGNWSDINHWVQSSGGTVLHTVVPQINDNVIFDVNAGFTTNNATVNVNVSTATCKNMTWINAPNNPIITGNSPIHIYGSLVLQPSLTITGKFTFKSSASEFITTNNTYVGCDFIFDGSGSFTLNDNLRIDTNNITILTGSFIATGKAIIAKSFLGFGINNNILNLTNATINLKEGFSYTGLNTTVLATNSIITVITNFTGDVNHYYNNIICNAPLSTTSVSGGIKANLLLFLGSGTISKSNTFTTLKFTAGNKYILENNQTQTITQLWDANTLNCTGLLEIFSSANITSNAQATVQLNAGATATISNAILKNIKAIGTGIPIVATRSFDYGNNTNINFPVNTGTILYWVGGTGNWNDATHWSTINNGIYPSVTGCIPTPIDDVEFNANSGFAVSNNIVTLPYFNQYCNNLVCNGAAISPKITGTALHIFGSITLQTNMTYAVASTFFEATQLGKTITTNGTIFNSDIAFIGKGGGWTLQDDLDMQLRHIEIQNGNFNTNSKTVHAESFAGKPFPGPVSLVLGASQIYMVNNWIYIGATNITLLNAGTSHIHVGGILSGAFHHLYYNITFEDTATGGNLGGNIIANNIVFKGNGTIVDFNEMNSLIFAAGYVYKLESGSTQTIHNNFTAITPTCSGLMEIVASVASQKAIILFTAGCVTNVTSVLFRDITINGPNIPLVANNSYDFGNNTNIVFAAANGTTYYWVGGSGNWNNALHWSLINNGVYPSVNGCVPTPIDNVVFNNNSGFTAVSNVVTLNTTNQYCKNFTSQGALNNPYFTAASSNNLNVFGSLLLQPNAQWNIFNLFMAASSGNVTINTNGLFLAGNINLIGAATFSLLDSLNIFNIGFTNGTFITNSFKVVANTFNGSTNNNSLNLQIGNSIFITPGFSFNGTNIANLTSGNSHIFCSNFNGKQGQQYNNITFTTNGTMNGNIKANTVRFVANGFINGSNTMDTLIFNFGKIYTLEKGTSQTIQKAFYPNGNPCFITRIVSSQVGTQAGIIIKVGPNVFDYIYVKDITANGSLIPITAEAHSTDDGNNTAINFVAYNNSIGIKGLGNDTTINCTNFPYNIQTTGFYPNPFTQFNWQNGSTNSNFIAADSGKYFVSVNYGDGCIVKDTIKINRTNNAGIRNVTVRICNNQSYILPNGQIVNTTGIYTITNTNAIGCDSIITTNLIVNTTSMQTVNKTICPGTNYTLPNGQVVNVSGIYIATLINSLGCDSIITTNLTVLSNNNLGVSISPNTTICNGKSIALQASGAMSYTWSPTNSLSANNIANPIATPTSTTTYTVTLSDTVCFLPHSLQTTITVLPLPNVKISKSNDLECNVTTAQLTATNGLANYSWSPSVGLSTTNLPNVIATPIVSTMYFVKATDLITSCVNTDSILVQRIFAAPDFPVPNAFTPNNDGVNDCFKVNLWGNINDYKLNIYNRWGQQVFATTDITKCWDGTFNGKAQNIGTYVYYITATNNCDGKGIFKKGTIVLMR